MTRPWHAPEQQPDEDEDDAHEEWQRQADEIELAQSESDN